MKKLRMELSDEYERVFDALVKKAGHETADAMIREALALYGIFIDAKAQGKQVEVYDPVTKIVQRIVNSDDDATPPVGGPPSRPKLRLV